MAHFLVDKRSTEKLPYDVNFSEIMGASDTQVASVTIVAYDSAGVDRTSLIVQQSAISGFVVTLTLKDGLDGEDYIIYVTAKGDVNSSTVTPVRVIELRVRDTLVGNM